MSKLRKIHTTESVYGVQAKVHRDAEWDEYRVRTYLNGTLLDRYDYFTSDKTDALATAHLIIAREAIKHGYGDGFDTVELAEHAAALDVPVPENASREQLLIGLVGTAFNEFAYDHVDEMKS